MYRPDRSIQIRQREEENRYETSLLDDDRFSHRTQDGSRLHKYHRAEPTSDVVHQLETQWLARYPWPTEIIMDRGTEFAKEVQACIKDEYGIRKKLITTRNPQANSIVEIWKVTTKAKR